MKRGRGRSGRKPSNNLNRTLESNGPDVKVRGTAHQICEKYQALARDAHASGDRIAYENYLQHAEHYHRIIAATQQVAQENAAQTRDNDNREEDDDAIDVKSNGNVGSSNTGDAESDDDGSEANDGREARDSEAPRRARRGRRTRPVRGNGKANGSGDDAASGEAEAPAETA